MVDQHYSYIVVAAVVGAVTFDAMADLDYYYCYAVVVVDQDEDHDEDDFDEVALMVEAVAWMDDDRIVVVVAAVAATDNLSVMEDDSD